MLESLPDSFLTLALGISSGCLLGLAARLGRFCTMGSIEDLIYGGSSLRMRMWVLAIGVAITGSFGLMALGLFDPAQSYYLSIRWMPLASVLGGLLFGYGMALAGNCGFGALARLGGGDLRSFVIVLVLAISAYATLVGPLAPVRNWAFPQVPADPLDPPGIPYLLAHLTGLSAASIGILLGVLLCVAALISPALLRKPASVFWAVCVGLAIIAGWAGTSWVAALTFGATPVVSHSYSAPMGETLLYLMTSTHRAPSFAVGSVFGVILGAFVGSLIKGHFRWEACEDPRELRRQIIGAALMGIGAVLSIGCTVGQGLSAFSVLSFSAPVTFLAIIAGAAFGLRQLITGFEREI